MPDVFVYGTLRRGQEAHRRYLADATFIARSRTVAQYELLDLGDYPGMAEGGRTRVVGELYAVPESAMAALDAYEGGDYRRVPVRLEGDATAEAYVMRSESLEAYVMHSESPEAQVMRSESPEAQVMRSEGSEAHAMRSESPEAHVRPQVRTIASGDWLAQG